MLGRLVITMLCVAWWGPVVAVAQNGTIQGRVVHAELEVPLRAVTVTMEGVTGGATTDKNGQFVLPDLSAGTYQLVVRHVGFRTHRKEVFLAAGESVRVSFDLEEQPVEIPEIVVERVMLTGGHSGVLHVPGSAQYIGPQELERFRHNDIQRVLRSVPGINIQEEDGYGLRPNIGLRGTGVARSSKITLMEDGVLMAPAPYSSPAAYYFPTAGRLQAVEVRKGSSQIKYGPYTTGGAINLVSAQIPDEFRGHVAVHTGGNNERNVHVRMGHSFAHVGLLLETYQTRTDGFKLLENEGNTGFDKKDYMGKMRFDIGKHTLTLKALWVDETSNETYLGLSDADYEQTPLLRYAASQRDVMNANHRHFIARHTVRPLSFMDVTTTLYRTDFQRDWYKLDKVRSAEGTSWARIGVVLANPEDYMAELALLRGTNAADGHALEVKHNNREYYAQGVGSIVGLHFDQHEVEVGVRFHQDEMDRYQWADLYRMDEGLMHLSTPGIPGTDSNRIEEAFATSAYVQYTWETGSLRVLPGIRYEHIRLGRKDYGKNDVDRTGMDLAERSNTVRVWIPGIGFDYDFKTGFTLFGGVHKGFAPPGSREETRPEVSVNYEVGGRYRRGQVAAEGVVFFNDYTNLLGTNLAAVGGDGGNEQFNGGAVHARGLEGSLRYDLGLLSRWNLSVPVRATYTWTQATFQHAFDSDFSSWGEVQKGDELPYLPQHQFSGEIGLETMHFGAHLSARYVSKMRVAAGQGSLVQTLSTDAYTVVDLSVDVPVTRYLKLFGSVRNLANASYIVSRHPAGVRPGLPRLFLLGLQADF